ncbi:MAG: short-chain dehydrogenase [Coxiella sp. DG_40]|nr:MAG: short-chain dehydrogenase [Coxiella sp. DG_40]
MNNSLSNSNYSLANKIVFITGATSGIGKACAEHFAARRSKILICGRRLDRLEKLANEIKDSFNVDIHYFQLDVTDKNAVEQQIQSLPLKWQKIDILVNNAGLARGLAKLYEGSIQDWEEMIDTNVKGLLYVTRRVLPGMVTRNSGHIINIGSIAGHEVYANGSVYAGTKHGVNAITRALRLDLLATKIRVTTVDPGMVDTEFSLVRFRGDQNRAETVYKGMKPLTADDIANAVIYCASCPPHVNISEMIIMPTDQASVTAVNRE